MKKALSLALALALLLSVVPLGMTAAAETEGYYTYTVTGDTATIIAVNPAVGVNVTVPSTLDGHTVTALGDAAFGENNTTETIKLPDSMTTIGRAPFALCTKLTAINVSAANTALGSSQGILYDETMSTLYCFPSAHTATSYVIPDTVHTVAMAAFYGNRSLKSVQFSASVQAIEDSAFACMTALESVTVPRATYGVTVFGGCTALTSVTFEDDATEVGEGMFYQCNLLATVTLSDGIVTIGDRAFEGCDSLQSIVMPASVTAIGKDAFADSALTTVWYRGSAADKASMTIDAQNAVLDAATWHFNTCAADAHTYTDANDLTCNNCDWVKVPTSIEITTPPTKTTYLEGKDALDLTGGKLTLYYADDVSQEVDLSEAVVVGFDNTKVGKQTLTVTCGGVSTTLEVTVKAKSLASIAIVSNPTKTAYIVGESLDTTGLAVEAVYDNGTREPITGYTVSGDTATAGENTVTVAYQGKTATFTITVRAKLNGWVKESGKWAYYVDDVKVKSKWMKDRTGWCYLGEDGYMVTNKWVPDSVGLCYVGANGYCLTNQWVKDDNGWCYVDANGRKVLNKWIKDSKGWCCVGADGYCITNKWMKDRTGWCYLGADGRMVTNAWVKDSIGWCYLGADGYAVTNCWKKDSVGWCYLNANGSMTKSKWLKDGGNWYYLNADGYMVTGKQTIGGKTYTFNANGVWVG